MAPSCSQNPLKIDAKIDLIFDALENCILMEFWSILGGRTEANSHPNRTKTDVNFERQFLENSVLPGVEA